MTRFRDAFQRFLEDQDGATVVEYVAIASGLGVALLATLGGKDGMLTQAFELLTEKVKAAAPVAPPTK